MARPPPSSGALAPGKLLEAARKDTVRIWAEGAPHDLKDVLKARGYRWNGEANGKPRAWYIDLGEDECEEELAFLRSSIIGLMLNCRWCLEPPHAGKIVLLDIRRTANDRHTQQVADVALDVVGI